MKNPNLKLLKKQTMREMYILVIIQQKIDKKCHQSLTQQFCMRKMDPVYKKKSVINIASGEGDIPASFRSEPNWEDSAFPKELATGKNRFNKFRSVPISPTKYVHARVKCYYGRCSLNPQ